jgi:hypothetical protein
MAAQEYRDRAAEAERALENLLAERARLDAQIGDYAQHRQRILEAAAKAGTRELAEQGVKRSLMTPAQKSASIRSRVAATGQQAMSEYMALPWK